MSAQSVIPSSQSHAPSSDEVRLHASMVRAQAGDAQAYRALLEELSFFLHRYFRARLGKMVSSGAAEDLVQDVLLSIHQKRQTFSPDAAFLPWFYAIARYRLIDFLRKDWRSISVPDISELESADLSHESSGDFVDPFLKTRLDEALAQLPEKQKKSVHLTKVMGFSVEEVSQSTGWKVSDIKVSVHRGLKALRKLLEGEYEF